MTINTTGSGKDEKEDPTAPRGPDADNYGCDKCGANHPNGYVCAAPQPPASPSQEGRMREALELVQRGMRAGKIKDQSILPRAKPGDVSIEPVALSAIIDAALAHDGGRKPRP